MEEQCAGEKAFRSRSLCGASVLGNENVQEQCALHILLGPGTVFQRPRTPCHERWGKELLLPLQESINKRTHILAPGSVGPIFSRCSTHLHPNPSTCMAGIHLLNGLDRTMLVVSFPWFLFSHFYFLKTYTLLLTAVNYNLSEKKKNS